MSKRERLIKTLETTNGTIVEVKVDYRIGGWNYFTGNLIERGIHLSVTPVRISKSACGQYTTRSYAAFSGVHHPILPMNRFSKGILDSIVPNEDFVEKMVSIVARKNNLTYICDHEEKIS